MGLDFPKYPNEVSDGDEHSYSPNKTTSSLLGTERGTDSTRRIETDANRNLFVNVGATSALPAGVDTLATGAQTVVADNLLTTVVTYTASSDRGVTKISCSSTEYAKFQVFKNTALIDTKRLGPDRNVEFVFLNPLKMTTGDILDVKVIHFHVGATIDCESSIYGA